jgi:hypothetical protein
MFPKQNKRNKRDGKTKDKKDKKKTRGEREEKNACPQINKRNPQIITQIAVVC